MFNTSNFVKYDTEDEKIKKRTEMDEAMLSKVAQKVVSLLSQPNQRLISQANVFHDDVSSPNSKAFEIKSLFLMDVLASKSQTTHRNDISQSSRALRSRIGVAVSPKTDRRSILRTRNSGSQCINLSSPRTTLQRTKKRVTMMSPIIKFTDKKSKSSESVEKTQVQGTTSQFSIERTVFGDRTEAPNVRGHAKTLSLIDPSVTKFSYEDKENNPYCPNFCQMGSPKFFKRQKSATNSRKGTPRPGCNLLEFSSGIQKAFNRMGNSLAAKNLVLSRMGISKDNLYQMVPLIKDYKLSQIDLSFNALTDDCLAMLSKVLIKTNIKIDFRGNKLSNGAIAKFKKACPGCTLTV